jgi:hypothetical protein
METSPAHSLTEICRTAVANAWIFEAADAHELADQILDLVIGELIRGHLTYATSSAELETRLGRARLAIVELLSEQLDGLGDLRTAVGEIVFALQAEQTQ